MPIAAFWIVASEITGAAQIRIEQRRRAHCTSKLPNAIFTMPTQPAAAECASGLIDTGRVRRSNFLDCFVADFVADLKPKKSFDFHEFHHFVL